MRDGDELAAEIERIARLIEELGRSIEGCQQAIILSRAAIACGIATLVIVVGVARSYNTAPVIFSALIAVIAGCVWLGASGATRAELEACRADTEREQAAVFDRVAQHNGWDLPAGTLH